MSIANPMPMPVLPRPKRLLAVLSEPVAPFGLAVFRAAFGLIMALWAFDYLRHDQVRRLFTETRFHFSWPGFEWVRPFPGHGMTIEFVVILIAALMIGIGLFYRQAALVFALAFTHFFLIDRTNYQNHYYLTLLLSWVMVLVPANSVWSLDRNDRSRSSATATIPRWAIWLLRFHVALPYLFGGIAKLESDWLSGLPMQFMLESKFTRSSFDLSAVSGDFLVVIAFVLTWGGLVFDLLIVPALLWPRTRRLAFVVAVMFHVANSVLFPIHVFPWLMIAATTLFFSADWPLRVVRQGRGALPDDVSPGVPAATAEPSLAREWSLRSRFAVASAATYVAFQILWPLRSLVSDENPGWTERGHFFSWRMMLRGKTTLVQYFLTDKLDNHVVAADVRGLLNAEQFAKFAKDPEMIRDLAHFLAAEERRTSDRDVRVHAVVMSSLNGRKPQLLIDPTVDLASELRGWHDRPRVLPLTEPLRSEPWTLPLDHWHEHVALPDLPWLKAKSLTRMFSPAIHARIRDWY